ncbi:Arf-GAP with dual PH domain-containing protein 1 [Clonorchis sinensis]|uniref:Arf-GAP with dual PH domain-containing protein 1 n=1 Tax=Clonorchis sinensis TaxID=79923 RepID=G7YSD9_CLOSI|nr:Arf-GAP with dual PH domain-containing protein 1 [Clonorchis sinensis]
MDVDAATQWSLDRHLPLNDEKCVHMSFGGDSANSFVMHGEKGPEHITRIDAKKDLGIWLSPNLSFSLHLEKSAQKAFAVLRMIRRTFSRITRTDFQILYGAYVRPLLEYANPVVYSGRTKDVILIEPVQRAATKMVARLKSMVYETRLAVLDLFPLEYRRLRGDLILTYALFEQGLANRFFTVDPANTRRGHGLPCGMTARKRNISVPHQRLGGDIRTIVPDKIKESTWDDEALRRFMTQGGNDSVNERLEAELPVYYRRPWPGANCPYFLCEAFVKSKYIHEEFAKGAAARGAQCQFSSAMKSGILLKKLRDSDTFCERFFELSSERNFLRYFYKPGASSPKESMDLDKLNITFIDTELFGLPPHTVLLQCVQDNATRHIFIRSEDSRNIINWYNAIRSGKFHRTCMNFLGMSLSFSPAEIARNLTRDIDMVGWLSKTGPRKTDAWRRRWCMLSQRHFLYTHNPLSAFANGELFIGSCENGFSVVTGTPEQWKKHTGYAFTINTGTRPFVFFSDTEEERHKWIDAIDLVLQKPLTLEESKRAALVAQNI